MKITTWAKKNLPDKTWTFRISECDGCFKNTEAYYYKKDNEDINFSLFYCNCYVDFKIMEYVFNKSKIEL